MIIEAPIVWILNPSLKARQVTSKNLFLFLKVLKNILKKHKI